MLIEVKKNHSCPICNEDNACAVAVSGNFDTPCWCQNYTFMPETLSRLQETQLNESCIFAKCALKSVVERFTNACDLPMGFHPISLPNANELLIEAFNSKSKQPNFLSNSLLISSFNLTRLDKLS